MIKSCSIANFLAISRRRSKLTQVEVAEQLRYSTPQFISNWERGVSLPPWEVWPTLRKLYGLQRNEVIDRLVEDFRLELERKI